VLDSEVLAELDRINYRDAKPAQIRRMLNVKLGKDVSYAQLAYEMAKRKRPGKARRRNSLEDEQSDDECTLS
jgi:hypothetical protein